ncbi:hypothetical protein BJ912DRAFT_929150 [Pholiota molesta]|nr:hypothetical protein BJ912DRAFT_929150 [Pholiota molesta]
MSASSPHTRFQKLPTSHFFSPLVYVEQRIAREMRTEWSEDNIVYTICSQNFRGGRANGDYRHSMPPDGNLYLDPRLLKNNIYNDNQRKNQQHQAEIGCLNEMIAAYLSHLPITECHLIPLVNYGAPLEDEARNIDPNMSASSLHTRFYKLQTSHFFSSLAYVAQRIAREMRTEWMEDNLRGGRASGDRRHSMPPDSNLDLDARLVNAFEMQRNRGPRKNTSITFHHGSTEALS